MNLKIRQNPVISEDYPVN